MLNQSHGKKIAKVCYPNICWFTVKKFKIISNTNPQVNRVYTHLVFSLCHLFEATKNNR